MTPLQFKAARLALGYNQRQMAGVLRVGSEAVIRSWESGRRPISGPAAVAIELLLARIETGTAETVQQGSVPKG